MALINALGFGNKQQPLAIGAHLPQLTGVDQDGARIDLSELLEKGLTYVYFFPRAGTPGCTLQACELRDGFSRLQESGIKIIGISNGKPESLKKFHDKRALPYPLLADEDGKILRAFGVPIVFGLPLRQSYLIRDGVVVWRDLHARVQNQVDDLLRALPHLPK